MKFFKMNKCIFGLLLALVSSVACGADACLSLHKDYPIDISPKAGVVATPERGRWCSDYDAAKALADKQGVPVLVFMGMAGCPCCNYLADKVVNGQVFADWSAERKILMVFSHYVNANTPAWKNFFGVNPAYGSGQYGEGRGDMPAIGVYWPKVGSAPVNHKFCGRDGRMKKLDGTIATGSLADQFLSAIESAIDGYVAYEGWRFAVGNTIGDRLEAEATTTFVDVPLVRGETTVGDSVRLRVAYPDGTTSLVEIPWGDAAAHVERVAVKSYEKGKSIRLVLEDLQGGKIEEASIAFVARENSPKNPTWRGVTDFGEWTMDLGAAQDLVAGFKRDNPGESAYTLALVGGSMWCPDCAKTDAYLIDTPAFKRWATDNNVACVAVDIPNWSASAPGDGPCLLTREAKEVSQTYIDADPEHGPKQSGAGYLSRWMIDDDAAAAQLDINRGHVGVNTLNGGWNRPERTSNTYRTGVPIFLLLNDDGSIAGRLETFASTSPTQFLQSNVDRLNDLLAMAGGREDGMHWMTATTPACELDVCGGVVNSSLSAVGTSEYWKLTGFANWKRVTFSVQGGGGTEPNVRLNLWRKSGGSVAKVDEQEGCLQRGVTLVAAVSPGTELFLQVEALTSSETFAFGRSGPSVVEYALTAEAEDDRGTVAFTSPGTTIKEADTVVYATLARTGGASGALTVPVEVDPSSDAEPDRYELLDDSVFWNDGELGERSVGIRVHDDGNADGTQTVVLKAAGSFYRLTITDDDRAAVGKLSIAETQPAMVKKGTVVATEGTDVRIFVSRINGASGAVSARLVATGGSFTDGDVVMWANRSSGVVVRTLRLPAAAECPTGKITVSITDLTGGAQADGATRSLSVSVVRANVPQFEESEVKMSLTRYVCAERAIGIRNLTEGGRVRLTKVSGRIPAGMKAVVKDGRLLVSGTPTAKLPAGGTETYEAVYRISETVGRVLTDGLTVKISFPLVDVAVLDPSNPGANPAVAKSRTFADLPVMDPVEKRIVGMLTVTIPPTGRVSGKYRRMGGTVSLSTKNWSRYDSNTGTLAADLTAVREEHRLTVSALRDGRVEVSLFDPEYGWLATMPVSSWDKDHTAAEWGGYYTVDFYGPTAVEGTALCTGDSFVTLKMADAGSYRTGKMRYAGVLANGQAFSGSATLLRDSNVDLVELPVFFANARDLFSAAARIRRGQPDAAVDGGDSAAAWWSHVESNNPKASYSVKYTGAAGGIYDSKSDLSAKAEQDYQTTVFRLLAGSDLDLGEVTVLASRPVLDQEASAGAARPRLSFNRSTGMVSGTFRTMDSSEKSVTATYKGVVIHGWGGCSTCSAGVVRPWAVGSCWLVERIQDSDGRVTSVKTGDILKIDMK